MKAKGLSAGRSRALTRVSVFLLDRQVVALAALSQRTQVPASVFIREGIDLALERHGMKVEPPKRQERT